MKKVKALQLNPIGELLAHATASDEIVTYVVDLAGKQVPLSRFGDVVWDFTPYFEHAARGDYQKTIDWTKTPTAWRATLKETVLVLMREVYEDGLSLKMSTIPAYALKLNSFVKWCARRKKSCFSDVRPLDMALYLDSLRSKGLSDRTIGSYVGAFRRLIRLRPFLHDGFRVDVDQELGYDSVGPLWDADAAKVRRTQLIPLPEATLVFTTSLKQLDKAPALLKLRDKLDADWKKHAPDMSRKEWGEKQKRPLVLAAGYKDVYQFEAELADLRTAIYIVIGLATGCRVHELGDIQMDCLYCEIVADEEFWWLRSTSRKIADGPAKWLAPSIVVKAVDILTKLSQPLRNRLALEMRELRKSAEEASDIEKRAKLCLQILEVRRNMKRLFLSESHKGIRSVDTKSYNQQLTAFARRKKIALTNELSTHQFRRTYAILIVNFNKGQRIDLITLKDHFKHASVLMTEWYASLSETDRELYALIEEEADHFDFALIDHWMEAAVPLGGGYGKRIKDFAGRDHQPIIFKSHGEYIKSIQDGLEIRSTGHSWCLVSAKSCNGRGLFDAPECNDCDEGVIDDTFTEVWQLIRQQHTELVERDDIGPGGRKIAEKALAAANKVLDSLIGGDIATEDVDG